MSVQAAIDMIKRFEGCRLVAYPDPASGGAPWTVGYGATGPDIREGTVWTQAQAESDLNVRVNDLYDRVCALTHDALPDECIPALVSFAYNLGINALAESTLLRLINSGHEAAAADEFSKWTHAAGHVMQGLVTRRAAERASFLAGLASQAVV